MLISVFRSNKKAAAATFGFVLLAAFISSALAADFNFTASVEFSNDGLIIGDNIEFVVNNAPESEPYSIVGTKGGFACRIIPGGKYGYFKVNKTAVAQTVRDLFIEITYFDENSNNFSVQYNSTVIAGGSSENYKAVNISKTNTKQWVKTIVCISDAEFRGAQNNGADFRISGGDLAIKSVRIAKQSIDSDNEPRGIRHEGGEFMSKTVSGYQAWFRTGGKNDGWAHFSHGDAEANGTRWPRPNRVSVDYYPDVSEYADSVLAQTGFADLGDGRKAKLFNSLETNVIDTHFDWMKKYGIDGAAVQRFVGELTSRTMSNSSLLVKIKNAAEAHNRIFFVMYDISGGNAGYAEDMKFDWAYNVEKAYELLNSPAYATVNGKPVVCIWGLGVGGRPTTDYQKIVDFFRSRDLFIILGVDENWRAQTQYIDIYKQADMISPWYVGRTGNTNNYAKLEEDLAYCNLNNLKYYPVIWSGFSWAVWNNGAPNQIPRNGGQFLWSQAYRLKQLGFDAAYIAMFDEYDEGTGIMKTASDYFDIPTDQYFVTASADGYWLSSDFQLRTAGEAIKMLKGESPLTSTVPVAHSQGPIYYRNSFESRYLTAKEAAHSGVYPIDPCFKNPAEISVNGVTGQNTAIIQTNAAKTGEYAARINGNSNETAARYYYKFADVKIIVKKGMELHFSKYAINEQGKRASIRLIFDDNTNFTVPANASIIAQNWTDDVCVIGTESTVGKTIVGIALCYEGSDTGGFDAYFDDIVIIDGDNTDTPIRNIKKSSGRSGIILANSVVSDFAQIDVILPDGKKVSEMKTIIYDMTGNTVFETVSAGKTVSWNLTNNAKRFVANGSYLVIVEAKDKNGKVYTYSAKLGVKK